ncbi:MAG: hypothetical protein ACTS6P_02195 [Candidatus Hodgkinia cicadicola]
MLIFGKVSHLFAFENVNEVNILSIVLTSERLTLNLFRWKFNFRRKWSETSLVNINGLS